MTSTAQAKAAGNNTSKSSRWSALALGFVLLLALALRVYYVCTAMVYHPIRGDAIQYHAYAWNMVHHGVFSHALPGTSSPRPDSFRDPGYPAFLAMWMYWLGDTGAWYSVVLLAQAVLGAATAGLGYLLGRRWLPAGWALAAGVLMAIWPHSITINDFILSETLAGFLLMAGLYVLGGATATETRHRYWRLLISGLLLSLAGLTNAVMLPIGAGLAIVLWLRRHLPCKAATILLAASMVLPAAWSVRNLSLPAQTGSSTSRAMQNLVQGSWPLYHVAYRAMIQGNADAKRIMDTINFEYHTMVKHPAKGLGLIQQRMSAHPLHYVAWYLLRKPAELWGWNIQIGQGDIYVYPTLHSPFATSVAFRALEALMHAFNPWLALLLLIGVIRVAITPVSAIGDTAAAVAVFATLVYSTLQAEPRYSIPFRALEMLLAMYAMHGIAAKLGQLRSTAKVEQAAPGGET